MHVLRPWVGIVLLFAWGLSPANGEEPRLFAIEVLDDVTGRGVPLVELETLNHVVFVTDSHGKAAIAEADLFGQNVYFFIRGHGYEFPPDGFGYRGKALQISPGGKAVLKVKRTNVAERLYRATGSGVYRDTTLLGEQAPIDKPLLNAEVFGCDSVMAALYRGKIHWFWGDTTRPHYPLGANFHISGATSMLPPSGGLAPSVGINFEYFADDRGSARPLAQMPGAGPTWISSVTVLQGTDGQERIYAGYVKIRNQLESYRWGFAVWNDETEQFDLIKSFDEKPPIFLEPQTHTFLHVENGTEYVYFTNPLPLARVRAEPAAFVDPAQYEGFTCLKVGTRPQDKQLDRDHDGGLRYAWKANTPPLTQADQAMLVKEGLMKSDERLNVLRNTDTGREIQIHNGSVYWNDYRQRFVMIAVERDGESSLLGDVWFAEADTPTGPWCFAQNIVKHNQYSFYNPKQHPFFDQDGGRVIYFEGTYTNAFSGNAHPTPRYDYNQIMYRLDLTAAALNLPVAFYHSGQPAGSRLVAKQPAGKAAFFALERPGVNTVAVYEQGGTLVVGEDAGQDATAIFHALPVAAKAPLATTTPLYEFVHAESGERSYTTMADWSQPGFQRTAQPLCRVWKGP